MSGETGSKRRAADLVLGLSVCSAAIGGGAVVELGGAAGWTLLAAGLGSLAAALTIRATRGGAARRR